MENQREPDAECVDCGLAFSTGHPSMGNLLVWRCSSCGGKLMVRARCGSCSHPIERKTGFIGVYGRISSPDKCEECGDKVGFWSELPEAFMPGGYWSHRGYSGNKSLFKDPPKRLRLAWVVALYGLVTGLVGAFFGIIIGAGVTALLSTSIETTDPIFGLSAVRFSSLVLLIIISIFSAAGAWYGYRKVGGEVSKNDPVPLPRSTGAAGPPSTEQ